MDRIRWYGPTLVVLVTVMLILIAGPQLVRNLVFAQDAARIELVSKSLEESELLSELSAAFRNVADVVRPSVVSIQVYGKLPKVRRGLEAPMQRFHQSRPDGFFDRDEEDDNEGDQEYKKYDQPQRLGVGSGWVYDEKGHIITNHHVVTLRDRKTFVDKIEVVFSDGDKRIAEVVNTDPDTDVAVLQVSGRHLHPARIAEEPVQQGEIVFAFGSPLDFEFSVSQGIVSAMQRKLQIIGSRTRMGWLSGYEKFIQTDAAIHRGNSGGPLTNIRGQVVGMNTAIASSRESFGGGGFIGLGFAIPIDLVTDVVDQILTKGRVARGWLGIEFDNLTAKEAATLAYDGPAIYVKRSIEHSPAEEAGMMRGDIVVKIDGVKIKDGDHLRWLVASIEPGTKVDVEVFRDGEPKVIPVKLSERPSHGDLADMRAPSPDDDQALGESRELLGKLGIRSVHTFTEDMARALDLDDVVGVLIYRVREGSIADQEGLKQGQIITKVMGERVESRNDLMELFAKHKDLDVVRLTVLAPDPRRSTFSEDYKFLELPKD